MNAAEPKASAFEAGLARSVGQMMRAARQARQLTMAKLVTLLTTSIHPQTYASYELAVRQITVARFVDACLQMGVSPPTVLQWALQQDKVGIPVIGLEVDLHVLLKDGSARGDLQMWARGQLGSDPEAGTVHIDWATIQGMATTYQVDVDDLVELLVRFTPGPRRHFSVAPK